MGGGGQRDQSFDQGPRFKVLDVSPPLRCLTWSKKPFHTLHACTCTFSTRRSGRLPRRLLRQPALRAEVGEGRRLRQARVEGVACALCRSRSGSRRWCLLLLPPRKRRPSLLRGLVAFPGGKVVRKEKRVPDLVWSVPVRSVWSGLSPLCCCPTTVPPTTANSGLLAGQRGD